jgi:hypothetical protein
VSFIDIVLCDVVCTSHVSTGLAKMQLTSQLLQSARVTTELPIWTREVTLHATRDNGSASSYVEEEP